MHKPGSVFIVLVLVFSLIMITACSTATHFLSPSTETPTITPTQTSTFTPTPTFTPVPTSTPTTLPTPTAIGGGSNLLGVPQSVLYEFVYAVTAKFHYYYATYDLNGIQLSPSSLISDAEFYTLLNSDDNFSDAFAVYSIDDHGFTINMSDGSSKYIWSDEFNDSIFDNDDDQANDEPSQYLNAGWNTYTTPDKKKMLIMSYTAKANSGIIYEFDIEKEKLRIIAQNLNLTYCQTFTSPDKKQLILAGDKEEENSDFIYAVNLETYDVKLLVQDLNLGWNNFIDFSPDSKWVLYRKGKAPNSNDEIGIAAIDGSTPPREIPGIKSIPLWSSHSPYMYWMGDTTPDNRYWHQIIRIDPDTLETKVLAEGYNIVGDYMIENNKNQCFESMQATIFYCGTAAIDLTQDPPVISGYIDDIPLVDNVYADFFDHWYSPDKSKVITIVGGVHHNKFYVIDLKTGKSLKLEGLILTQNNPNPWSPDGRLIVGMETEYPKSVWEVGQDNRKTNLIIYDVDKKEIRTKIPIEADGEMFPVWLKE